MPSNPLYTSNGNTKKNKRNSIEERNINGISCTYYNLRYSRKRLEKIAEKLEKELNGIPTEPVYTYYEFALINNMPS
jgi:hypothetical protein